MSKKERYVAETKFEPDDDIVEYFSCICHEPEHVLQFWFFPCYKTKEKDGDNEHVAPAELFLSVRLDSADGFFKRFWKGIKYITGFGSPSRYGMWGNWSLRREDAVRLRGLLDSFSVEPFHCGGVNIPIDDIDENKEADGG